MNHSAYAPAAGEMRAVIYEQAKSASELRAGKLGTLQIQLVYYRGLDECRASRWTSNAHELARIITGISCRAGTTQIGKILAHIRKENAAQKVSTAIFVGGRKLRPISMTRRLRSACHFFVACGRRLCDRWYRRARQSAHRCRAFAAGPDEEVMQCLNRCGARLGECYKGRSN
jgi:hypothetical protein